MRPVIVFVLLMFISIVSHSQNEMYTRLMKETVILMDTATTIADLQKAAHQFQRIGDVVKNQWLPYYYCAYCYVQISHKDDDDKKKDQYVVLAEEFNDKADKLDPENSEIYVMKGFILQAKINVDRLVRGLKYNSTCLEMFKKAQKLDPKNPRSYLWHGVHLFNTPAIFGGGVDKALPLIEKAIEKYNLAPATDSITPFWGQRYANEMIKKCYK